MKAYCLIRDQPWYRRDAFVTGLKAAGLETITQRPDKISKETVVVMWNRYSDGHDLANRVEAAGGMVIVAENGYIGAGGGTPKFQVHPAGAAPGHYYAVSPRFHNDALLVRHLDTERWKRLGLELKPWRTEGEHILVCPNRSFGVPGRSMPPDWAEKCEARLRKITKRPIKIRRHPGNNEPARPLSEDLRNAWAVYVWTSSCGVHSLVEGIPTFVDAPYWIMKDAAATGDPESPATPERQPHFEKMAWAQWTIDEIATGAPFRHILNSEVWHG